MAIGNRKNETLMHECFPKYSRMGTARMKEDKETDDEGKQRGVSMKRSKVNTKEISPASPSLPNQNTILIKIMRMAFYNTCKKYTEIQLTKNKMCLNNRKMTNHPPSRA